VTGSVVVVGSLNMDLVVQTPRLPGRGETIIGSGFRMVAGGKGANQAVAVAKLGSRSRMIGCLGKDVFAEKLRHSLAEAGVDLSYLQHNCRTATGTAIILVEPDGENSIVVDPGANGELRPAGILAVEPVIAAADVLLVQLEVPLDTVEVAMRVARRAGTTVVLDPAPAAQIDDRILGLADVITPNEHEAGVLAGYERVDEENAREVAVVLRERGVKNVIVKLGAGGAGVLTGAGYRHIPAVRVRAVDTTAAGDVFAGALCHCLVGGADMYPAVRFASVVAALSVTRHGAQSSIPSLSEVRDFMKENRLKA